MADVGCFGCKLRVMARDLVKMQEMVKALCKKKCSKVAGDDKTELAVILRKG